jgi:hypothetical protein
VAFLEDVCTHPDRVADDALYRIASTVELWSHTLDRQMIQSTA